MNFSLDRGWNSGLETVRLSRPTYRDALVTLLGIIARDLEMGWDEEYRIRVWDPSDPARFRLDLLGNAQEAAFAITGSLRRINAPVPA